LRRPRGGRLSSLRQAEQLFGRLGPRPASGNPDGGVIPGGIIDWQGTPCRPRRSAERVQPTQDIETPLLTEPESLRRPFAAPAGSNGHTPGIVFDFDGTLVDSYPMIELAFAHVMRTHQLDTSARDTFRKSRGLPLPEQMKLVAPDRWEQLVETYRSVDQTLDHARVFRGIPTLLKALRAIGAPLGVVSCKRRTLVEAELRAAGLQPYFEVVIGYEDVTPPKPAPDPLLAAIARLGVARSRATYVGDSVVDLQTGRAARVRTVVAAWGLQPEMRADFPGHRLWATRPSEMLSLVLSHANRNGHRTRRRDSRHHG
jgi:pyrophosphatase PpaX